MFYPIVAGKVFETITQYCSKYASRDCVIYYTFAMGGWIMRDTQCHAERNMRLKNFSSNNSSSTEPYWAIYPLTTVWSDVLLKLVRTVTENGGGQACEVIRGF